MALSQSLIDQFVKLTTVEKEDKEVTVNGTYKKVNNVEYVRIDGSDIWTPVNSMVEAEDGERVKVLIKNHTATITGNITSPSARNKSVESLKDEVDKQGNTIKQMDNTIIQQGNSIIQLDTNIKQVNSNIQQIDTTISQHNTAIQQIDTTIKEQGDSIVSMNNEITQQGNKITSLNNTVESQGNTISEHDDKIVSMNNSIISQGNEISAHGNKIELFDSDIKILNSGFKIEDGVLTGLSEIIVQALETNSLDAKYANIDFTNINYAAVKKIFSESGIIKDLIVSEGKITGELVGVTIKGDLIEGNTVKADKLVVKGEDGLYYKLNVDALGETKASSDEKYQNGLDGSVIITKSIVAEKVAVDDLVAFGATIGGFNITENSIYSGVKSSVDNTTSGIYMDNIGQIAIGDSNSFIKYFLDPETNIYKLNISAGAITMTSTSKTLEETINDIQKEMDNIEISGINLFTGYNSDEMVLDNYQDVGGYISFDNCLTFNPCETVGQNYTISFWAKSPNGSTPLRVSNSTNNPRHFRFDEIITEDLGSEWEYLKLTITNTDQGEEYEDTNCNRIEIYAPSQLGVSIKKIKVEKGDKATEWSPAPDNIYSFVADMENDVGKRFETLNTTIEKNQSTIQQLSDMISHLITDENGGSLMTQTSDGWSFNMSSINGNLEAIKSTIANMETDHSDTNSALAKLTNSVNDVTNKTAYITMATDDNGDPCIELGKSTNTFKVRITNSAIDFLEGSTKIAYANNNTFYATKMIVKNELQIGPGPGFVWRTRSNGNMGLVYISG